MSKKAYAEYLQSEHWKVLKRKRLEIASYRCEVCGSPHMLHVHHLRYKNLYDVLPSDLQVLCDYHHSKAHGIEPKTRPMGCDKKALLMGVYNKPVKRVKTKAKRFGMTQEEIRLIMHQNKHDKKAAKVRERKKREFHLAFELSNQSQNP
jgi:hypothetical protein